ncbi:MAG: NUDIX domain-containing protein, partial [Candidatus Micrarchaeaceae archaeon]
TTQAALREVYEEIGLRLQPSDLKLISVKETLNFMPHLQALHFVYSTTISESTKIILNAHCIKPESESYQWFDVDSLPDRTLDSKNEMRQWRDLSKTNNTIEHT